MRRRYRRKYDWDLFGSHCGMNIIGRLDWINGKPMVYVAVLNVLLIVANRVFVEIPEMIFLTSHWGWNVFNVLAKIAFWVLFVDGVIVKILWTFTRGKYYCPYLVRKYKFPELNTKKEVKEELAWAWFLFTHPEFDYKMQELKNRHTVNKLMAGEETDMEAYRVDFEALLDKYGIQKDEKGNYFSWNDRKYRRLLEKM